MFRFLFLLLSFCLLSTPLDAQKKIKDFLNELNRSKEDTVKVNLYNSICNHYLKTNIDSVQFYAQKGIDLAKKLGYKEGEMLNLNALGNYYENKTEYSLALKTYNKALDIAKKINSNKGFAILYNNIGMVYIKQGKYEEALVLMLDALRAEEIQNNTKGIAQALNNIGVVYYYQKIFDKATEYFEKSLSLEEESGDTEAIIQATNNLGAIYDYLNKNEKAIAQYEKALKINTENNDKRGIATNLHNIAVSYYKMGKHELSKQYHNQSIEIRKELKDQNALSLAYFNYGEVLRAGNENKEAEKYYKQALDIAEKNGLKIIQQYVYGSLAQLYQSENNYKLANDYLYKHIAIKDSILNKENSQIIAEAEAKYQSEKKEKEIFAQRTQLVENQLKIERKNRLIGITISIAILIALIGWQLYRAQKNKNIQLEKEKQLNEALSKIETQNKLQQQRLRISRDLHDNIGSQLTLVISSMDNLKFMLQKEHPETSNRLEKINLFARTTISELRDTIWAMNRENISVSDLKVRINNLIDNARLATKEIEFNLEMDSGINEEYRFSAFEGINIYRVIQEAINNAIKHGKPNQINVKFKKSNSKKNFTIVIQDNGVGLDENNLKLGNGVHNMRQRIEEIGGVFELTSEIGKGTNVKIAI